MNRMLENNPVPCLWLSNSVHCLDPAFVRRFDMVIELPVPPQRQRERIIRQTCGDVIDTLALTRVAAADVLTPAIVAKAMSVVSFVRDDLGTVGAVTAFQHLINQTLEAQGHRPISTSNPDCETYDPCFINADADLVGVADGIARSRSGRLCLFGPPGSGKTAFGRWLADRMEVPLRVQRASDIMSKWVGESEQNIARAFREAERDGALLLIDEVDTFLQDRHGAQRSWEISLVNEMLTQMESFPGVFIASTNLMIGIDQAALRRFDLKVKFDFLRPEQAWGLLCRTCAALTISPPHPELRQRLARLSGLTPGDFAAVVHQNRFRSIETSISFIAALEAECQIKEGGGKSIGFV
jgi:hypothetical protein